MRTYIYTTPKAGTYFLASLLELLEQTNSGWHIFPGHILDTHSQDLETNARTPDAARKDVEFARAFRDLPNGSVAFGHFAAPLLADMMQDYVFLCGYRHPRRLLVSEFVDFRYRRTDLIKYSRANFESDAEAFAEYISFRGPKVYREISMMLSVESLVRNEDFVCYDPEKFVFLNFDQLLRDPVVVQQIARVYGYDLSDAEAADLLERALAQETKTKATGFQVDRDALWSDAAEETYATLDFEGLVARNGQLNWDYAAPK